MNASSSAGSGPTLPRDGIAALREYVERGLSRLDGLSSAQQLRVRSAMTLHDRLKLCVEERVHPSLAMFSPADLWALREIADELNAAGFRPKKSKKFTGPQVRDLLYEWQERQEREGRAPVD